MTGLLFVLALLVGFLTGVTFRDALDLLLTEPIHSHSGRTPMRRTLSWLRENVLVLAVVAAMVMNGVLGVILINGRDDLHSFVNCVAQYEHDKDASTKARSDAAADVSKAQDALLFADTRADAQKALQDYRDLRREQDRQRRLHPPPDPPKQICGVPV